MKTKENVQDINKVENVQDEKMNIVTIKPNIDEKSKTTDWMDTKLEKTEEMETVSEKQKRKYSPNYMLQNYKTLIKNLDETGMLDDEDRELLKGLGRKMITRFISIDMFN